MLDQKITTVIIETDSAEIKNLSGKVEKVEEFSVVGSTSSAGRGIDLIQSFAPQLVFVNVGLDKMDGLELVGLLRNRGMTAEVIFIAGNDHRAFESLSLEPFDFLVKPIGVDDIRALVSRLKSKLKRKELIRRMDVFARSHSVRAKRVFPQKRGIVILPLDEIIYCKAELTNTIIGLQCGEEIPVRSGINETFEIINNTDFVRIGRSYFINRNYLRKIDKRNLKCILYYNGQTWDVPISKNSIHQIEKLNVLPIY